MDAAVGVRNPVVAGQAALRYSLMRPPQRVVRTIRSCCPLAFDGCVGACGCPVGAYNSVVGADQGFRAPSGD